MTETLAEKRASGTAFTAEDLRRRARNVLLTPESLHALPADAPARRGDFDLNPGMSPPDSRKRPAAVLVPVIDREPEASVLFTERTAQLRAHGGQISFPGGRMEADDATPVDTALRETSEETGIDPAFIEVLGFLEPYQTSTGFRVVPAIGIVAPGFVLRPDSREVEAVFEVPLRFLMNGENHELHSRPWRGSRRYYYAMPYGERYIWGATAGMLRNLYEWLYR